MKIILCVVVLVLVLAFLSSLRAAEDVQKKWLASEAEPVDEDALLDAIAEVESGNNSRAIGAHGERSAYQITPQSWAMHTRARFELATREPSRARQVARMHLAWTVETLRRTHAEPSIALIAAAWRYGPGLAWKFQRQDYARRVCALYALAAEGGAR